MSQPERTMSLHQQGVPLGSPTTDSSVRLRDEAPRKEAKGPPERASAGSTRFGAFRGTIRFAESVVPIAQRRAVREGEANRDSEQSVLRTHWAGA
jgi:hypothetical protein